MLSKLKSNWVWICGGLALAVSLVLISLFVYVLNLRTEYRADCMAINDAVIAALGAENTIAQGDVIYPLSDGLLNYYNAWLRRGGTVVFDRKAHETTDKTIVMTLPGGTLMLTGVDDWTAVNILWETADGTVSYTVRNEDITFFQLSARFASYGNQFKYE